MSDALLPWIRADEARGMEISQRGAHPALDRKPGVAGEECRFFNGGSLRVPGYAPGWVSGGRQPGRGLLSQPI
jgi:hypothetical protein